MKKSTNSKLSLQKFSIHQLNDSSFVTGGCDAADAAAEAAAAAAACTGEENSTIRCIFETRE